MNVSHDLQHIQALYKEMQLTLQLTKKPVSRPQAKICQRSVSMTNKVIFHFDQWYLKRKISLKKIRLPYSLHPRHAHPETIQNVPHLLLEGKVGRR